MRSRASDLLASLRARAQQRPQQMNPIQQLLARRQQQQALPPAMPQMQPPRQTVAQLGPQQAQQMPLQDQSASSFYQPLVGNQQPQGMTRLNEIDTYINQSPIRQQMMSLEQQLRKEQAQSGFNPNSPALQMYNALQSQMVSDPGMMALNAERQQLVSQVNQLANQPRQTVAQLGPQLAQLGPQQGPQGMLGQAQQNFPAMSQGSMGGGLGGFMPQQSQPLYDQARSTGMRPPPTQTSLGAQGALMPGMTGGGAGI